MLNKLIGLISTIIFISWFSSLCIPIPLSLNASQYIPTYSCLSVLLRIICVVVQNGNRLTFLENCTSDGGKAMKFNKILDNLQENDEYFDNFNNKTIRFRRFSCENFQNLHSVLDKCDWFSAVDNKFILVDDYDKCKTPKNSNALIRERIFTSEKNVCSRQTKFYSTPKSGRKNEVNVEGSPLRVSFMEVSTIYLERRETKIVKGRLSIKNDAEKIFPLEAAAARGILGRYNVEMSEVKFVAPLQTVPLLIACNGAEPSSVVLIGGCVEHRTIDSYCVRNFVASCQRELPSLVELIGLTKTKSPSSTVYSRCNVLQNENSSFNDSDGSNGALSSVEDKSAQIYLTSEWKNVLSLMEKPPKDAVIKIHMVPSLFDSRSSVATVTQELLRLLILIEGLTNKNVDWIQLADENINVVEKVRHLIEKVHDEPSTFFVTSPTVESIDQIVDNAVIVPRHNFDFTEMLWGILKYCGSEESLIQCLKMIFDALACGSIKPAVHATNNSLFARLIRDSFRNNLEKPVLDGSMPLRLLLDVGIEKLQRDYVSALCDVDLIPFSMLEDLIRPKNVPLDEKVSFLAKLHWCLQVFVLCRSRLNLSLNCLRNIIRDAFVKVKNSGSISLEDLEKLDFATQVQRNELNVFIEQNWKHSVWLVQLTGDRNCDYSTDVVLHVSDELPFPYLDHFEASSFCTKIICSSNVF